MADDLSHCALNIPPEVLSDWLSNLLDVTEQMRIGRHVASCAACQATIARYRRIHTDVRDIPIVDRGEEIWQRLHPHLARRQRRQIGLRMVGRAVSATLIAALLVGFVALFTLHRNSTTQPVTSSVSCDGSLTGQGVFVARSDGSVQAFDGATGVQRWRTASGVSAGVVAAPIVTDGMLLVTSSTGTITALHAGDGRTAWTLPTVAGNYQPVQPIEATSVAVIDHEATGWFVAVINVQSGAVVWRTAVTPAPAFVLSKLVAIAATPQMVVSLGLGTIAGKAGYEVFAFAATTGTAMWQSSVQATRDNVADVNLLATPEVVAVLLDRLTTFIPTTGKVQWTQSFMGGTNQALAEAGDFLLAQGVNQLAAFRLADGATAWEAQDIAAPLITDGQFVYAGDISGHELSALDVHTGGVRWQSRQFGLLDPLAQGCGTVIGAFPGTVQAFSAANGMQQWAITPPPNTFPVTAASVNGAAIIALPSLNSTSSIGVYDQHTGKARWVATGNTMEDGTLPFAVGAFT
jgi:outer membrane protein assembly factor BamB